MLIIFEGINYSGKTTLSKEVSKTLAISNFNKCDDLITKLGGNYDYFDWVNFGINKSILEISKKFNFDLILDEGFLTDLAQTSFIRHKDISLKFKLYSENLNKIKYIIIFLVLNNETLRIRLLEKYKKVTEGYLNDLMIFQNYFQELGRNYKNIYFLDAGSEIKHLVEQVKIIVNEKFPEF